MTAVFIRVLLAALALPIAACTAHPWRNPHWTSNGCTGYTDDSRICHFYRPVGTDHATVRVERSDYMAPLDHCMDAMRAARPEVRIHEVWQFVDDCMEAKGWHLDMEVRAP